ncbi:MAG: hypothetical protein KAR42_08505 [candidate division Zixibacteria bacterium]|nr:hypothetical protein [candidate division Zixibacteria bacterium]
MKNLVQEFSPFHETDYYLVVSFDYVCFFSINRKSKLSVLREGDLTGDSCISLSKFVQEIKKKQLYCGQQITVLLAEPVAFNLIRNAENQNLDDLRKDCNSLFSKEVQAKYQKYDIKENSYYVVYGYDESFAKSISEQLVAEKVFVSQYLPLFGFIFSEHASVKNRGRCRQLSIGKIFILLGYTKNNEIVYFEKTGNLTHDEQQLLTDRLESFPELESNNFITTQSILIKQNKEFVLKELTHPNIRQLSTAIGSCKLLVSICLILVLCLGVSALVLNLLKDNSEQLYMKYEDKLMQISALEQKVKTVDKDLSVYEEDLIKTNQLSAGLSKFCQRKPKDLVLAEIYTEKVDGQKIYYSIQGKAEKEDAIFRYQEYVNSAFGYDCMKIQSMSKQNNQRNPQEAAWYKFSMVGE